MFRYKALQKISTPEDLTRNIQVTNYTLWVLAVLLGVFLAGFIAWACVANLSTRVQGVGLFLPYGGRIIDASAPYTNTLKIIKVDVGDYVEKGDALAEFSSVDKEKALNTAQRNLTLDRELHKKVDDSIKEDRIQRAKDLKKRLTNIRAELASTRREVQETKASYENSHKLFDDKLITQSSLSNKRLAYTNARKEAHNLESRIDTIKQNDLEKRNQEDLRLTKLEQSIARNEDRYEIALSTIAALNVLAPVSGEVVEIKAPEGVLLSAGSPFLSIMTNTNRRSFTSIRMAEGSINDTGTPLISFIQTSQRNEVEFIAYVNAQNGKKIKPGVQSQIEVDYLDRNEFGMVEGVIISVSEFPITSSGIQSKIANQALVNQFTKQGTLYEVRVQLKRDLGSKNGFAWTSSKGAEEDQISVGSLGNIEFIVETRKPITLLLPLLRSFFN